jgi:glycosyltransferase involved in cell wall biosynthesis
LEKQFRVSIIIPTFNRAALVAEAVASVLAQSRQGFELLVVDDGSSDRTLRVLEALPSPITIIHHAQRRGVSAARNSGIKAARGEWLAFLDSDDCWLPGKLEKQLTFLAANPAVRICQTEELWLRRGVRVNPRRRHQKKGGWIFQPSLELCLVSPSAVILHRQILQEIGLFDESLLACEDYDLWLRIAWRYPIELIPEALIIKRGGHPDQLSAQWGLDRYRVQSLVKLLGDAALPKGLRPMVRDTLVAKAVIYAQGCEKRGRVAEAEAFRRLVSQIQENSFDFNCPANLQMIEIS